jgi:hypothetical protein
MNRLEERLYEIAAQEVATKKFMPALMAKAFSDADGDEKKTIARYIRLRVRDLAEDFARQQAQEEARRQAAKREELERLRHHDRVERDLTGEAMCLGCRQVVPKSELHYWQAHDVYCHEACLNRLNFEFPRGGPTTAR